MHLKRYGILLAALLMAACQDEEAVEITVSHDAVPIAFECTLDTEDTRATHGYTGNLTQENNQLRYAGFGVFMAHDNSSAPDIMYNQQVEYNFLADGSGKGFWTYSPLKYWPAQAVGVCFYAYAPYVSKPADSFQNDPANTGIVGMSSNSEPEPFILYARVKHPENHVDLLWNSLTVTQAMLDATTDGDYRPNKNKPVKMQMQHALARVKVSLGLTDDAGATQLAATDKLLIERVTFTGNFAKKGTLDLTSTGTTPTWSDQVLADPTTDPATDKTIFIDCDPETNTDSYGIIAESARYINGLPYSWQPDGVAHTAYDSADPTTSTNLLCMGDAPSFLYLIPQDGLTLSCVVDYSIITAAGVRTAYHKTLADATSISISPLNGNTTYDLTLKLKFNLP